MSKYLIAPVNGALRGGLCIDEPNTQVREDFIRITRTYRRTQIDIGCIAPPLQKISKDEVLLGLKKELQSTSESPLVEFIQRDLRRQLGLSENEPREVLVATYVCDKYLGLIYDGFSLTTAKIFIRTYDEFSQQPSCLDGIEVLTNILEAKGQRKFLERLIENTAADGKRKADYLVMFAMVLFNLSCREVARKCHTTFFERPQADYGRAYFKKYRRYSTFNRVLRDSTAFVNTANFISCIKGEPEPYSEEYLKNNLPHGTFF
jgi:hypothetical protein